MDLFSVYKNFLFRNLVWLRRAGIIALAAFVSGFFVFIAEPALLPQVLDILRSVFQNIAPQQQLAINLRTAVLIFQNNFYASLIVLFLGVFLGLTALIGIAVNFFILGFLLAVAFFSHTFPGGFWGFVISVGPHGILEIPAFLLSGALGLRLGWFWKRDDRSISLGQSFLASLKDAFLALPLLIAFFFAAALVEIFVTGNLVRFFLK